VPSVHDTHRIERAHKRIQELRAWRHAAESPLPDWTFTARDETSPIQIGDDWPVVDTPVQMAGGGAIPADWTGQPVELEIWLGGEGLLTIEHGGNTLQVGLDPFHHNFVLTDAASGGEAVMIAAELVPKGMFGSHVMEPRFERAHVVIPNEPVRALDRDLANIIEACEYLGDHDVVARLLDVVEESLRALSPAWPTATDVTVTRLVRGYVDPIGSGINSLNGGYALDAPDVLPYSAPIWHLPPAPLPLQPLPEAVLAAVDEARAIVSAGLDRIKQDYPPAGKLAMTGHAHIDLAWLWPVAETRRKGRRTFSNVLDLMNRYEDFRFNQSSAQLYAWIEEDDPALFARVSERIAEGRWEPVGGSWVEPDCQVTGGEAFVRQLFYGQRYFEEKFGKRSAVAWLPDVFGFSPGIPQLLRGAGITRFFTIKLNWSETNFFPHDLFVWEGIDGSRVVANMFRNLDPAHGYNGSIRPRDVIGTWRRFDGKRHTPESLLAFGWGDGGGGPTTRMLENYEVLREFPALPSLRMANLEQFFADLPETGLPRWVGELYLEYHRGTLTTQALVKRLNREAEHRLLEAELFATLANLDGAVYPGTVIDTAWKSLLLNQFHDILPGSSIAEVYEDTHRELTAVVETATSVRDAALARLASGTAKVGPANLLVANASLAPRTLTVELPNLPPSLGLTTVDGSAVRTQATATGTLVHEPEEVVPGVGWIVFSVSPLRPPLPPRPIDVRVNAGATGVQLQNDQLLVEIGADGTLHRVHDRVAEREVLEDRANQIWTYVDKPRTYDAWDIEDRYELDGAELSAVTELAVVESGPLRAAVRVVREFGDSRIEQTYRLLAGSRRVDIETVIDWHERQVLLKAIFPLAIRAGQATFETMYGTTQRPTHRNTSWDAAKFEVSAHRFADLSEAGYGVALLNNGKYGHSALDNTLTLSLVRGPLYPDPYADEGHHEFAYAILPHAGTWAEADVPAAAFAFNSPLIAASAGTTPAGSSSLLTAAGTTLQLGSLKRAADGDGIIVRLFEPNGARGPVRLHFGRSVTSVEAVNLLEEADPGSVADLAHDGHDVTFSVRPYQVLSLRLRLGNGSGK
jgi:alpha-mannosidase